MSRVLGGDVASKIQAGTFTPTSDQINRANAAGCFSAQVTAGPVPAGIQGSGANPGAPGPGQGPLQGRPPQPEQLLSSIAVAPPPQFQADSPAVSCAKQIVGADQFSRGIQPTPDQLARLQSQCFAPMGAPGQPLLLTPDGRPAADFRMPPNTPANAAPPALPSEIKSCVLKAGITEADISAIQSGQPPTEKQQQQGEACFKKYAQDKGYALPTLTPPDPSQPFDPHSKQNECADLVAQTHGLRFNQINPGIVAAWGTDDIGKLRSCYGVAAAGSAPAGGMIFAPSSTQVAIPSSKLNCIEQAVGASKLAAVVAGTATITESDREAVYNKCINPNKVAPNANPALLGVLAAMPPSDLESQFIPINTQQMPQPSTNDGNQTNSGEVAINGEVDVPAGATLPAKVDVFVKSTPTILTVALTKVNATRATWAVKVAHNKLALGNHKAYAVATLADATQVRSPEVAFAVLAKVASNPSLAITIGIAVTSLAAVAGAWLTWRWHAKHAAA